MKSAIEVLPARSMVTVSSAFRSSIRARTRRRVSLVSGRTLEPATGALRGQARESAGVDRGAFSFRFLHCIMRPRSRRHTKIGTTPYSFQPLAGLLDTELTD